MKGDKVTTAPLHSKGSALQIKLYVKRFNIQAFARSTRATRQRIFESSHWTEIEWHVQFMQLNMKAWWCVRHLLLIITRALFRAWKPYACPSIIVQTLFPAFTESFLLCLALHGKQYATSTQTRVFKPFRNAYSLLAKVAACPQRKELLDNGQTLLGSALL